MARTQHNQAQRAELRAATIEALRATSALEVPESLPLADAADDLRDAIRDNQVVVVAGETGSGKSTQLPKLCLDVGRGVAGLIGHTQPRRVAARSIAQRLADETGTELGSAVGYAVRFTDQVSDASVVKVMTDGILLAEIQRDRLLRRYDTLIIDEAHERSLNIDFLLGFIATLLPQRPDLKVIVTSATIDTQRFAEHFSAFAAGVAVVQVSGRSYPVEVRYRPFGEDPDDDRDQVAAISDALAELAADRSLQRDGDVLVFLSGEREIHDTADALRRQQLPNTEIVPLYARLSSAEQQRIFQTHTGRRIVLSTNVAETSLTVPGIRFVIDAGTARISRYSTRLKVQRLPIEPISQASANQRAGRCGRVAAGVCIRLYGADDFEQRDEFTEPEILRTNLASVILQMAAARLGRIETFPFLDVPDPRSIRNGYALLEELGAIDEAGHSESDGAVVRLTPLGRRMARLPIDPRLARMVIESERLHCVREVTVIAAALSIQDPREYPSEHRQAAEEVHRRTMTEGSDLLAFLRLWDHLRHKQQELSNNQFRKLCRADYLNYLRVREWQDLYSQVRRAAADIGIRHGPPNATAHVDHIHRALLAGLLSQIGLRDGDKREYRGAHGSRFVIGRDSAVGRGEGGRGLPRWVVAAELVETNRLWARRCAPIKPEWAEQAGRHLARYSYGEPRWDAARGTAVTTERVSLFGLPIVAGRTIHLDRVDQAEARSLFIRHALVGRDANEAWLDRQRFLVDNDRVIEEVAERSRRRRDGMSISEATIEAFYGGVLPANVTSTRHFDRWWKDQRSRQPDLLTLTAAALGHSTDDQSNDFPGAIAVGDLTLDLTYRFDPGEPDDGVTVHVPITVLNRIPTAPLTWPIPGFRGQAVDALVRSLPKSVRRELSPLGAAAEQITNALRSSDPGVEQTFADAVAATIGSAHHVALDPMQVDIDAIPDHLRLNVAIIDDRGQRVDQDRDIDALRVRLGPRMRSAVAKVTPVQERRGITSWDFGRMAEEVVTIDGGVEVVGYPALLDDGDSVSIRTFSRPDLQRRAMAGGVHRLLRLAVPVSAKAIERSLSQQARLDVAAAGLRLNELIDTCVDAALDAITATRDIPWNEEEFAALAAEVRQRITPDTAELARLGAAAAGRAVAIRRRLEPLIADALQPMVADVKRQLERLVRPGFVRAVSATRMPYLDLYLRAAEYRVDRCRDNISRDRQRMDQVHRLEDRYRAILDDLGRRATSPEIVELAWMLEGLRVSLFAPSLSSGGGGQGAASAAQVERAIATLTQPE